MLYEYILQNYKEAEPIFFSDLEMEKITKSALNQQLKVLCQKELLKKYDTGVYYLPKKTLLKSTIGPNADMVARYRFVSKNGKVDGFYGGNSFANQIGISTQVEPEKFAVCEYELDREFADLLRYTDNYVSELRKYQAFISPDASLYWDMPFAAQVVNKYRSQAIGYYMQRRGIYVIPNVRWGDERTYTTKFFPEKLAFLGVEKHSIVSIGSYGVVKTKEEKKHFRAGLESMLETLEPETVLVYGAMPEDVFDDYLHCTEFIKYPDWTTYIRSEDNG